MAYYLTHNLGIDHSWDLYKVETYGHQNNRPQWTNTHITNMKGHDYFSTTDKDVNHKPTDLSICQQDRAKVNTPYNTTSFPRSLQTAMFAIKSKQSDCLNCIKRARGFDAETRTNLPHFKAQKQPRHCLCMILRTYKSLIKQRAQPESIFRSQHREREVSRGWLTGACLATVRWGRGAHWFLSSETFLRGGK